MRRLTNKQSFILSITAHASLLLFFLVTLTFSSPLPVLENTNKNDVISAVILGDTKKSKMLPQIVPPKPKLIAKVEPKIKPKNQPEPEPQVQKKIAEVMPDKNTIALKLSEKKKKVELDAAEKKKQQEMLAKEFLSDLDNIKKKEKKIKQVALKSQFEKTLREQAEKSLRDQLLDEEIKLKGTQSRQSQGEVNKYKALILQAISEHWIVPIQANKKLYCELMIRVAPGGMVLDVQVSKSSGDPSLDSSARAAVLKASPLPVPPDAGAFESFRQFVLKVKPENILS